MAFQFRFESLLDLRRRQRDQAGAAVGQAIEAIRKIDQQRSEITSERDQIRSETAAQLGGRLSVDRLLSHGRYELQLEAQAQSLLQTRDQLAAELAQRQQRLVEAEAEVKRFERLEQRERDAFETKRRRREQFEHDDAAAQRYAISLLRRHRVEEADR